MNHYNLKQSLDFIDDLIKEIEYRYIESKIDKSLTTEKLIKKGKPLISYYFVINSYRPFSIHLLREGLSFYVSLYDSSIEKLKKPIIDNEYSNSATIDSIWEEIQKIVK